MANSKEFNLFSYVYGRLFAEQYFEKDGVGYLYESSKKIYSWQGILFWLKKEGHLFGYEIGNVDFDKSVIVYKFNRQSLINKSYIRAIEKNLKKNSLEITPMGEFVTQLNNDKDRDKLADGFEAQFKKPVEYLIAADRCLKELNQKIMDELTKADSNSSNNDEERKAA